MDARRTEDRALRRVLVVCRRWLARLMAAILRDVERGRGFSRRSRAIWSQYHVAETRMLKATGARRGARHGR